MGVKLTYHDVDSDLISLGSTEELMDALEQYLDQRFVRMNAKVERQGSQQQRKQKKRLSIEESNLVHGIVATNPGVPLPVSSQSLPKQAQAHLTSNVDPSKRDQLQNVVGSIVQMLGSASA